VLQSNQFRVNEVWIIFKLNDAPVLTDLDGEFNVYALMDAASCYILDSGFVPVEAKEISRLDSERMLSNGYAQKNEYPKGLIIPDAYLADNLKEEAERCGIRVRYVAEDQLLPIIGEARQGFQRHFSGGRAYSIISLTRQIQQARRRRAGLIRGVEPTPGACFGPGAAARHQLQEVRLLPALSCRPADPPHRSAGRAPAPPACSTLWTTTAPTA